MNHKTVLALLSVLCLTGCRTAPVKPAASPGNPEVSISGAPKSEIIAAIIDRELAKGWDLKTRSASLLVFAQHTPGTGTRLLSGSKTADGPENRVTFSLEENGDETTVRLGAEVVAKLETGSEASTDITMTGDIASRSQAALDEIKSELESRLR